MAMQLVRGARRCRAAPVVLLGSVVASSRVQAAELVVHGPASCPDVSELTFRVERVIGVPLAQAAPLRFDVQFDAASGMFSARLEVEASAASGTERVLRAQGCSELADAVAVAIALALGSRSADEDPGKRPRPAESGGTGASGAETSSSAPPPVAQPSTDAASVAPEAPNDTGLSPALSMAVVGDAGSLPGAGLGAGA
jgi:hypothetical protein